MATHGVACDFDRLSWQWANAFVFVRIRLDLVCSRRAAQDGYRDVYVVARIATTTKAKSLDAGNHRYIWNDSHRSTVGICADSESRYPAATRLILDLAILDS